MKSVLVWRQEVGGDHGTEALAAPLKLCPLFERSVAELKKITDAIQQADAGPRNRWK